MTLFSLLWSPPMSIVYLSPDQVAEYFALPPEAIARWRHKGFGPRFRQLAAQTSTYQIDHVVDYLVSCAVPKPELPGRGSAEWSKQLAEVTKFIRGTGFSVLLTEDEVAGFAGLNSQTLEGWRHKHRGPAFYRFGKGGRARIRYRLDQVVDFLLENSLPTDSRRAWKDQYKALSQFIQEERKGLS